MLVLTWPELDHVVEVVAEGLDAVDVWDDDQFAKANKEVRPSGSVVVEQVDQVSTTLSKI